MNLKVGDIINYSTLGLMVLTEVEDSYCDFNGQALFKMEQLFGKDDSRWVLYEQSLSEVTPATDDDIVELMTELSSYYSLGDNSQICVMKTDELLLAQGSTLFLLSREQVQKLKDVLNRFYEEQ